MFCSKSFECVLPVSKDRKIVQVNVWGSGWLSPGPPKINLFGSKRALLFVVEWRQNTIISAPFAAKRKLPSPLMFRVRVISFKL